MSTSRHDEIAFNGQYPTAAPNPLVPRAQRRQAAVVDANINHFRGLLTWLMSVNLAGDRGWKLFEDVFDGVSLGSAGPTQAMNGQDTQHVCIGMRLLLPKRILLDPIEPTKLIAG
jgi:hypothetical protein